MQIILMLLEVTDVVCWPQRLLHQLVIGVQQREGFDFCENFAPEFALVTRAISPNLHSIIRSTDSNKIPNWVRRVASLDNEAADECSLGNAYHIELSLAKNWMLQNFLASFLRLLDH